VLGNINPIANRVAAGRKQLARKVVLNGLASIPAVVFYKTIDQVPGETADREELVWGGLGVLTDEDEQAIDYKEKGFAIVMLDQFTGTALNKGLIGVDSADAAFFAQIEPFDPDIELGQQLQNSTGWYPESGDVLCLLISKDYVVWVENVGQQGQSIHADFGVKYLLNKRDDLAYLAAFQERPKIDSA